MRRRRAYTIDVQWRRLHGHTFYQFFICSDWVERALLRAQGTHTHTHQIRHSLWQTVKFEFISLLFGWFWCRRVPFFPLSSNWIIIRLSAPTHYIAQQFQQVSRANAGTTSQHNNINALFAVCTNFFSLLSSSVLFALFIHSIFGWFIFLFLGKMLGPQRAKKKIKRRQQRWEIEDTCVLFPHHLAFDKYSILSLNWLSHQSNVSQQCGLRSADTPHSFLPLFFSITYFHCRLYLFIADIFRC